MNYKMQGNSAKKRVRKNHQQGVEQKNTKTKNGDKKEKMEVKEKRKKMIQKKR